MGLIDQSFGVSPAALALRSQRFELLSANMANADTPGYKARDIDFADALARARHGDSGLRTTHRAHIAAGDSFGELDYAMKYRIPAQPTVDGNTVETDQEHAAFMDNAIRYQASLNFLNSRIKSMISALRGE